MVYIRKLRVRLLVIFFFICCVVNAENQKEIALTSRIDASSFYTGVPFLYTILIDGSDIVDKPNIPEIKHIAVKLLNSKILIKYKQKGFELRYYMVPEKDGDLTIPPFEIIINRKVFMTQAHKIKVMRPESIPGLKISVELSKKQCYVAEPIEVIFTWYSALPFYGYRGVNIDLPLLNNPAFKVIQGVNDITSSSSNSIGLPVSNRRIIAKRGEVDIDGDSSEFLRFTRVLIPMKAGDFKLQPATLLTSYLTPKQPQSSKKHRRPYRPKYPSYFNNNFFDDIGNQPYQRFYITFNSPTLEVLNIPQESAPLDFYGMVGKCNVETSVKPTKMRVGDPLTLTIRVKNYSFPSAITLPPLSYSKSFSSSFLIPAKQPLGALDGHDMVFQRILRPLRTDVSEIPQMRISYFDPETGAYSATVAPPIKIEVLPAETATTFDAELSGDNKLVNKIESNPEGIRHNVSDPDKAFSNNFITFRLLFAIFAITPPFLFLIVLIVTSNYRLQRNYPIKAVAKFAARRFYRDINKVKIDKNADNESHEFEITVNKIDNIFRRYFSEKFNIQPHAHTIVDLKDILKNSGVSSQTVDKIKRIYDECSLNRYTDKNIEGVVFELKDSTVKCVKYVENRRLNA